MTDSYREIVRHYERCLETHGAGARAVDWKDKTAARIRYAVMADLFTYEADAISVLDFGCGLGAFKDYLDEVHGPAIVYEGLDLSPEFAARARERHPDITIHCLDVLKDDSALPSYDYAVLNGIFTRRAPLSHGDMLDYLGRLAGVVWRHCRRGLAFNVMSHAVDWKGGDLFHPGPTELADVIAANLSPHFTLCNDYGLYECTCYVYREPRDRA